MKIIWTNNAENSLDEIIDEIIKKFSIDEAFAFHTKVFEIIEHLKTHPEMGKIYNLRYRKFVITKQTSLFYRIDYDNQTIFINYFFYNRKNPNDLGKIFRS